MYSFKGKNPTKLYYIALQQLMKDGDECSPRGKLIKELRPSCFEFDNPNNRITFLGGRRINPFFQIAEALWILSGRADVEWLCKFNANMKQFSDDGIWFNAPYGERIRSWNKNSLHGVIINPIDQLVDAYTKLLADKDTRQAVIVISNPMFDNSKYTLGEKGRDIACNLVITFKIRHNKLNMTVFNRSNDLHWGTMGANLNQFSTIQETMLSWLKNSGNSEFIDLEMGTYSQITDSLHIYLDDYGSKCTQDVLDYYKNNSPDEVDLDFTCKNEPRMSYNKNSFDEFLTFYWSCIDPLIMDDSFINKDHKQVVELLDESVKDDYWNFGIKSMLAYRLVKINKLPCALEVLGELTNCQWKISMLYFLKHFIQKETDKSTYNSCVELYKKQVESIEEDLVNSEYKETLKKYLELGEATSE